jgi:hypothetical protein
MVSLLNPRNGTVSYNGHLFLDPLHARIIVTPVITSDGRSLKKNIVHITIETIVDTDAASTSTDAEMEDLFKRLTQPGKVLKFSQRGFHQTFEINTATNYNDIMYGPIPTMLSWEPIGHTQTARIVWTVECHIYPCDDTSDPNYRRLTEMSYALDWDIQETGLLHRTIRGHMEVEVRRVGPKGNYIDINATTVKDVITGAFPTLPNYTRTLHYTLSPDRRRLDFYILDNEIPSDNPYFPGTIRPRARYSTYATLSGGGFRMWHCSLSGSIEWQKGGSPVTAFNALTLIMEKRLATNLANRQHGGFVLMESMAFEESIWERTLGFNLVWIVGIKSLDSLFAITRMFTPLEGGSATGGHDGRLPKFSTAAQLTGTGVGSAWKSRNDGIIYNAQAKVSLDPKTDPSVSRCNFELPEPPQNPIIPIIQAETPKRLAYPQDPPPKENSWLDLTNTLTLYQQDNVIVTPPGYTPSDITQSTWKYPTDKYVPDVGQDTTETPIDQKFDQFPEARVHRKGPPTFFIRMVGHAIRAGYKVTRPRLLSYSGMVPIDLGGTFKVEPIKRDMGCPVYAAKWDWLYQLPKPATGDINKEFVVSNNFPTELLTP